MVCLSIPFQTADVSVRQHFAFSEEQRSAIRRQIPGAVLLCTCNRMELYAAGDPAPEALAGILSQAAGLAAEEFAGCLRIYTGSKAIRHLFRVACGIDSMVVGEDEILRQVKEAYRESAMQGTAEFEIHTVFQSAVTCAKRVKTDTALSRTPVSVATLVANEAARLGETVQVLLIGASGRIGSSVLKNLASHPQIRITMTIRSHEVPFTLPSHVCAVPYAERMQHADAADCIISATSSPHYTVTAKALREGILTRKPRLLIDLAVPPDMERSCGHLPGVRMIGIDDFEQIAQENRIRKQDMVTQAEAIIAEELEVCLKKSIFHGLQPDLERIRSQMSAMTPDGLIYHLRETLDSSQFAAVASALRQLGMED